jgi:hypothetical protein
MYFFFPQSLYYKVFLSPINIQGVLGEMLAEMQVGLYVRCLPFCSVLAETGIAPVTYSEFPIIFCCMLLRKSQQIICIIIMLC